MRYLKAVALGAAATAVVLGATAAAFSILVASDALDGVRLAVGPALVLAVEAGGEATSTALGPGLAAVALCGGLLNAGALAFIRRRRRSRDPIT